MKTFKRQFDESYKGSAGEINKEPSQTVPDQTISLRKLLHNHTRNIPSPPMKLYNAQYSENEVVPVISDRTEIEDNFEKLQARKMDLEELIENEKAAKKAEIEAKEKREKEEAANIAAYKKYLQSQEV